MLTSATPPRKVFDTIQILRGLAALIVVLFHLSLGNERRGQQPLIGGLFQNGFAGVDLFFVISGFVIMHTSHRYFGTPDYFATYIRKRLIRIYPIYWITFVVIVGGLLLVEFVTKKSVGFLPTSWDLIVSAFLLLPNHPNINGVTWSLSFELYYYLLFGLLILSRQLWLLIAIVLTLSGVATLNPNVFTPYPLLTFFFSPYNLEFASGVLIWWLIHQYKFSTPICFLLLLISGVWLLVNKGTLFEEPAKRTILYGLSSFLLVLSFTGLERNGWFQPSGLNRLLMKIGDASYLIYIFHFPFLPFYGRLLNAVPNTLGQHIAALLFTVVLIVVCIDLHSRFEAPLVKKLNLLFKPVSPKPDNG
ncbi:acyltransferase family protein [Spirosoma validum]|uniref:Acyltransferase n=1 Tax=Spirosoma validum TaxID=2771355 RepID=A0A927GF40_9BACT|nr:acyltransferase [Spirosoma validum]MBD2755333.1 acyltransferase [Spirosoma validum]